MEDRERHGRESYFVVGEGLLGVGDDARPAFTSMSADLRAFRFSRLGPTGRQPGEPARRRIAAAMTRDARKRDSAIPAGYTYLGQFVDHDLTFDRSRLGDDRTVPIADLVQGRSPSLDLDALYGLGPSLSPGFYADDGVHLRRGTTIPVPGDPGTGRAHPGFDVPRRAGGAPRIPDPRNDENLAVAQIHAAFIRFHNRVVDVLAADGVPEAARFEAARTAVVKHYQWMLRTDFLPRIVRPGIVDAVFGGGRKVFEVAPPPGDPPTMPVEFSVAAYRAGHSMVRSAYDWNRIFDDGSGTLDLLFTFSGTGGDLGGEARLISSWIADLRRLFDFDEHGEHPELRPVVRGRSRLNMARRIDTLLADPLAHLPAGSTGGPEARPARRNLAFRNLTRARMLRLATGQQMAALMRSRGVDVRTLTAERILEGNGGARLDALNAAQRAALARDTPLWFYVLREAELAGGRLSGVGGRLVAETFHRAMEGSAISILGDPGFTPALGVVPGRFGMTDLLLFAAEGREELLNPLG
ncbi:peroxidase family protein [Miltoncostaea marina]|uniref:peroxidase family protein n=1 Tax=Miltoncostaea marina TaxID=2843215 RepID=UPI001C3DD5E2|nr:heme peroxidase family protein [Miltoncostaea marina]